MNIGIEQLVSWGGSLTLVVGMWFRLENRVDRLTDKDSSQQTQINGIGKSFDEHQKEDREMHHVIDKEIGGMKIENAAISALSREILNRLEKIEIILEQLRNIKGGLQ